MKSPFMIDEHVQYLLDHLLEDESELVKRFAFSSEGEPLSDTESLSFIRFLKEELLKNTVN